MTALIAEPKPTHSRFVDLTDQLFGSWRVIGYFGKKGKVPYWICRCRCGREQRVNGWNLNRGLSTQCRHCRDRANHDDLTGQSFGRLLVREQAASVTYENSTTARWQCECACGNVIIVFANALKNNRTTSCGCYHREIVTHQLIGRVFDRLTVEAKSHIGIHGQVYWKCRCCCGEICTVRSTHLETGNVRSCGCLAIELLAARSYKHGLAYTKEYRAYCARLRKERKRMLDEQLTWTAVMDAKLRELQPACVVCDSQENLAIDHVLPLSKGHALRPGNAVRLCRVCNNIKFTKDLAELPADMADRIATAALDFLLAWGAA